MSLEAEFDQAMHGTYEAARKRGYTPTYFLQMLEEHRGVGTAQHLLAKADAQSGLFKLWELDLLHESMESLVVQERFKTLFTAAEIIEAHRRLDELGYLKS